MDSFFSDLVQELGNWVLSRIGRILEGHNFAAIATVVTAIATLCIALILLRGLDPAGIAALAVVATIIAWAVYSSVRRVLTDLRMARNRSQRG